MRTPHERNYGAPSVRDSWLKRIRNRARGVPGGRLAWRIGITILGVVVLIVGVVLLPFPGPGWLTIFAGLGILATEYVWAHRLLGFARRMVGSWTQWLLRQSTLVRAMVGLGGVLFLGAALWVSWYLAHHL